MNSNIVVKNIDSKTVVSCVLSFVTVWSYVNVLSSGKSC